MCVQTIDQLLFVQSAKSHAKASQSALYNRCVETLSSGKTALCDVKYLSHGRREFIAQCTL